MILSTESLQQHGYKESVDIIQSTPPKQSRVSYSRLLRTVFSQVLNISRNGDFATSLGSLCQFLDHRHGIKSFLMLKWNFLIFSLHTLSLVLSLGTAEKFGSVSFIPNMDMVKIPLSLLLSRVKNHRIIKTTSKIMESSH